MSLRPDAPRPAVEIQNVAKRFGATAAVDGLSFDILAGQCVALLGPSGCGKTTTLRMLAGFEQPTSGTIMMEGRDVLRLRPYERNVGLVFQDYALFPHMTVADNVAYGMRRRGTPRGEIADRLKELIALVRLDGLEARRPAELSGGQQQRAAIARALAPRPALLLLDEPLSNLDARLRLALRQSLREILSATGATTLLVTHDQEEAMAMADRMVVLDQGRVQQAGAPRDIYRRPANRFVAEFLGACLFLPAESDGDDGGLRRMRLPSGATLRAVAPTERITPTEGLGVMIRPESLRLRAAGEPAHEGWNRIEARVISRAFLGANDEVAVRLADGGILHLRQPSDGPETPIGANIALEAPPEACVIVPERTP